MVVVAMIVAEVPVLISECSKVRRNDRGFKMGFGSVV